MVSKLDAQEVMGSTVFGADGGKIGKVGSVFVDDNSGIPEFATVRTGLFGKRESFVPMGGARFGDDELTVPYDADRIKNAPNVDVDDGRLTPQEAAEIYSYYGTDNGMNGVAGNGSNGADTNSTGANGNGAAGGMPVAGMAAGAGAGTATPTADRPATGRDRAGGEAMTRSEEQLHVGTEEVETGRARLRKYVVTEEVDQKVPVRRERVRVEHEPITRENQGQAASGTAFSEAEQEVILHEERPVISKETVPVEQVRLTTETESGQTEIHEQVRKERIEEELPKDSKHRR